MVFGVTRGDPKDVVTKVVQWPQVFIIFFNLFAFMTLLQPFIALIGRTISHTMFFYDATIALANWSYVDHSSIFHKLDMGPFNEGLKVVLRSMVFAILLWMLSC